MEKSLILYAEDDADDQFIFEDAFFRYRDKVEILPFNNGLELIEYLNSSNYVHPSLVVLDINMPKLDGRETLRILRSDPVFSNTPVAILTTSSLQRDADFANEFNAAFFTKSMSQSQMQNITTKLLSYCGLAAETADLKDVSPRSAN